LAPKADRISAIYQMIVERETDYLEKLKQTQKEITKTRHKNNQNLSKAQLKKQEKACQQAW
jgi:septal ring factor EnvC (AmiA/AmiB activator)